jgi:hypothetical protein
VSGGTEETNENLRMIGLGDTNWTSDLQVWTLTTEPWRSISAMLS